MTGVREWFGALSVALSFLNLALYARVIFTGKIKPHAFSWLLWAVVMGVVFAIQTTNGSGAGAWQTGGSAILCVGIGLLSLWRGERNITFSDRVAFFGALLAIPLWVVMKDALGSVILLSAIDSAGYYPTFRKSWHAPHQESIYRPARVVFILVFSILATERASLVTLIYPCVMMVMEIGLGAMLLWRRRS